METLKKILFDTFESTKQIIFETLTNPDKEYSSKKIMTFVSFNFCILQATLDQLTSYKVNETIFYSFLLMANGQSVLSIAGNKINFDNKNIENKIVPEENKNKPELEK